MELASPSRSFNLYFLAYLSLLTCFVLHALFLHVIVEDAYITFRYANNWASGKGLLWNASEVPVEGYTNFLWVVICAALIKLGFNLYSATLTIGILSALGIIEFSRRFAQRFLACNGGVSLMVCLLLAASGPLAAWAGSGMETVLFGLAFLAACYFFAGYWQTGSKFELVFSFLLALVGTLLRPEGLLLFALFLGLSGFLAVGRFKQVAIDLVVPSLVFLIPFSLYFYWRLDYFGDPLPNTFYAKTGGGINQVLRGGQYVTYFAVFYLLPLMLPMFLVIWERGFPGWQGEKSIRSIRALATQHVGWVLCLLVCGAYTSYIVAVGGDYMAMYRFMVPVIPFIYLLLAAALQYLSPAIKNSPRKIALAIFALGISCLATVFHSTPMESSVFAKPSRQHGNYRGVVAERWHVARLSLIGKFFNDYKTHSTESVATRAIGAIGYFADMEVHDLAGLTDPHIARMEIDGLGKGWAGHEKMNLDYSFRRLPTYFMISREFADGDILASEDNPVDIARLSDTHFPRGSRVATWIHENPDFISRYYKLSTIWLVDEANNEEGYFSFLELKDKSVAK